MRRTRHTFARTAFLAGSATAVVQARARAAEYTYKCASEFPVEHPAVTRLRQLWSSVERETNGRLRVEFYPNNQLGSPAAVFNQLRLGAVQFQLISPGNLSAVVPTFDVSALGFVFKDENEAMKVLDGPLGAYLIQEAAAKGIYVFRKVFDIGMYHIGSTPHPIRTPDDLRGFKVRIAQSKITVDLFRNLGANPTPISFDEIYTALQTKLIDGEAAPLVVIETSRFFEINKYISLTNHAWASSWLIGSNDVWKGLPPDIRAIVDKNAEKYTLLERRDNAVLTTALENKLARQGLAFNPVDQAPFRARLGSYYDSSTAALGTTAMNLLKASLSHPLT